MAALCTTELLDATTSYLQYGHLRVGANGSVSNGAVMSWKDLFETIYYLSGSIAALGTLFAALFALGVYKKLQARARSLGFKFVREVF